MTTFADEELADGACGLREAIAAATRRAPAAVADCPGGTGNGDVVELAAGTYPASAPFEVSGNLEIRGAGMEATKVSFTGLGSGCAVRVEQTGASVVVDRLTLEQTDGSLPGADLTGACVTAGSLRIRDARVTGFSGGGLMALAPTGQDAKLEVLKSLVDRNTNPGNGGGVAFSTPGSWIWVAESAIVDNASAGLGGGIFAAGGTNANYIFNSTISGNRAWRGAGLAALIPAQTYLGLYWSTIVGNEAADSGGGLFLEAAGEAAHTLLVGDIVVDNAADGDPAQANLNAGWTSNVVCTFSLAYIEALAAWPAEVPAGSCLYDVADAKLGPRMDMGGVNHLPMYPLLPGSPAIDAIDEANSIDPIEQRDTWNQAAGDPPVGTDPGDTPAWSVWGRARGDDTLADMGAYEFSPRWEAELLVVADLSAAGHTVVTAPEGLSNGAGTRLAGRSSGDYVTYQVPIPEPGPYAVSVGFVAAPSGGQLALSVADGASGPFAPVGEVVDAYAPAETLRSVALATVSFVDAGSKFFRFTVTGRNDASGGYDLILDDVEVTKP